MSVLTRTVFSNWFAIIGFVWEFYLKMVMNIFSLNKWALIMTPLNHLTPQYCCQIALHYSSELLLLLSLAVWL